MINLQQLTAEWKTSLGTINWFFDVRAPSIGYMMSTIIIPFRFALPNSWIARSFVYFRAILFKNLGNCTTGQISNPFLDYLINFMLGWIVYFGLFRWILCDER